MTATIFDIQRGSFVDGPGIRTAVFFKGCNLKCKWCHNPESRSANPEIMFYKDKCTHCGRCGGITANDDNFICFNGAKRICGKLYTVDEVFAQIEKDKTYYENSGGGVTFSGGECMLQIDFLCEILKKCKQNGIHTAVDTAGNVLWESFEKILPFTDLFLYDIKAFDKKLHKDGAGVSNTLILKNLERLSGRAEIIIRIPVIGGYNDNTDEMRRIADFLKGIKYSRAELLPYHALGEHKYDALGLKTEKFYVPDKALTEEYKKFF